MKNEFVGTVERPSKMINSVSTCFTINTHYDLRVSNTKPTRWFFRKISYSFSYFFP